MMTDERVPTTRSRIGHNRKYGGLRKAKSGDVDSSDVAALSETDKARIRREEIFREEVRRGRCEVSSRRSKALKFANTPFGLWCLSTLVVGLVSWGFTHWVEISKKRDTEHEAMRRLNVELARRAAELRYQIELDKSGSDTSFREVLDVVRHCRTPIFDEFAKRPLSSVLWERASLEPESGIRPCTTSFNLATTLEEMGQTVVGPIDVRRGLLTANRLQTALAQCVK
jgi:hypothetical protein